MLLTPKFVSPAQLLLETSNLYIKLTTGWASNLKLYVFCLFYSFLHFNWWQLLVSKLFKSQAFESHLLLFFSHVMCISKNSICSIFTVFPEPAPSHCCTVTSVKIWVWSFLRTSVVSHLTLRGGKSVIITTYTITLLFLVLSYDSPLLIVMTLPATCSLWSRPVDSHGRNIPTQSHHAAPSSTWSLFS